MLLEDFKKNFKDEYNDFNIKTSVSSYFEPIITAFNNNSLTNLSMSQINLQYNMDKVTINDFEKFKMHALNIFELLTSYGIEILHTAIMINAETFDDQALDRITSKTINKSLVDEDLVDVTLKFGKKHEDLFYKIVTLVNKKQIKIPPKKDELGRLIPIPLISWNGILVENEVIDVIYEINDKYSFDFTKNYHTTEFYLNKMLYILQHNFENDINNILEQGDF